jgi:hypothetical protein
MRKATATGVFRAEPSVARSPEVNATSSCENLGVGGRAAGYPVIDAASVHCTARTAHLHDIAYGSSDVPLGLFTAALARTCGDLADLLRRHVPDLTLMGTELAVTLAYHLHTPVHPSADP